ncbi:MAG: helix-turn-helix transcriptional regulator [Spirochaetota bacterium]
MSHSVHPMLAAMIPLVDALAGTFGRDCEVVLHDVSDLTSSVIAIANGHVTNRGIGAPATDLLVSIMEHADPTNPDAAPTEAATEDAAEPGARVNYHSHTEDGRLLKCTTIPVRDEGGKILGALCINYDLTHLQVASSVLEDLSRVEETDTVGTEEAFPRDANSFLQVMIDQALSRLSKPVALLTKKDNLEVIRELDENDIFSIKHAVETVARRLNVSRYTIYNYIDEVRSERRAEPPGAHRAPGAPGNRRRPANAPDAPTNTTGTEDQ